MYLDFRDVLEQTLGGGYVDVRVARVFADDVENCVVSSSDVIARRRCWLQLLLKGDQHTYGGDQKKGESGEHGQLRAS